MTANVTVEVARADDTLHVPASALRFSPTPEVFAMLGQPVPETKTADARASAADGTPPASAAPGGTPAGGREGAAVRGGAIVGSAREGGGSDEQREARRARLAQLSPEERAAAFAGRGGGRGGRGQNGGAARGNGGGRNGGVGGATGRGNGRSGSPRRGGDNGRGEGQVWAVVEGRLEAVRVRTGISDGANVAVSGGGLKEGVVVATGLIQAAAAPATPGAANPLLPQRGRGGFGGGRGGGGARGGGGGRGQ